MYFLLIHSPVGKFRFYLAICFHLSWVSKRRVPGCYDRCKFNFIHCGFYLYFPGDNVKLLFMYLLAIHLILWSVYVKSFVHLLNKLSSYSWVVQSLYILWNSLSDICQIFSPCLWLEILTSEVSFEEQDVLALIKTNLSIFSLMVCAICALRNLYENKVRKIFSCFLL